MSKVIVIFFCHVRVVFQSNFAHVNLQTRTKILKLHFNIRVDHVGLFSIVDVVYFVLSVKSAQSVPWCEG